MLIVCPNCATSYMIEPASVGPAGRAVRCARCKTTWFAGGPKSAPEVTAFVNGVIREAETQSAGAPSWLWHMEHTAIETPVPADAAVGWATWLWQSAQVRSRRSTWT